MFGNFPSRTEAEELFEWVISRRNSTPTPFVGDMEETFRLHCVSVAKNAELIASKTGYLNPEIAYIMGLLHDCGRIIDEFSTKKYHGVVGYKMMNKMGYPDLAKICLTHSFIQKDFDINAMPHPQKDMLFCKAYLDTIEYNDWDKLVQLTDCLNDLGKTCTIEYRCQSLAKRYNVPYSRFAASINEVKNLIEYFNKKINCNIYQVLGII